MKNSAELRVMSWHVFDLTVLILFYYSTNKLHNIEILLNKELATEYGSILSTKNIKNMIIWNKIIQTKEKRRMSYSNIIYCTYYLDYGHKRLTLYHVACIRFFDSEYRPKITFIFQGHFERPISDRLYHLGPSYLLSLPHSL